MFTKGEFIMLAKWFYTIIGSIFIFGGACALAIWSNPDNGQFYFTLALGLGVPWLGVVTFYYLLMNLIKTFTGKDFT